MRYGHQTGPPFGVWLFGAPLGALFGAAFEAAAGAAFAGGRPEDDPSYAILDALGEETLTGYEVLEALRRRGSAAAHEAIVYPGLQMLEDMGYVERVGRGGWRAYRATAEGRDIRERRAREAEEAREARGTEASEESRRGPAGGGPSGAWGTWPFFVFGRCGCRR